MRLKQKRFRYSMAYDKRIHVALDFEHMWQQYDIPPQGLVNHLARVPQGSSKRLGISMYPYTACDLYRCISWKSNNFRDAHRYWYGLTY